MERSVCVFRILHATFHAVLCCYANVELHVHIMDAIIVIFKQMEIFNERMGNFFLFDKRKLTISVLLYI